MFGAEAEEAAPAVWRLSAEDQSFDHPNNVYQLGDAGPDTTDTDCHNWYCHKEGAISVYLVDLYYCIYFMYQNYSQFYINSIYKIPGDSRRLRARHSRHGQMIILWSPWGLGMTGRCWNIQIIHFMARLIPDFSPSPSMDRHLTAASTMIQILSTFN